MLRYLKVRFFFCFILLFGELSAGYCVSGDRGAGAINDVRVLIDVSGSMNRNDPAGLRVPALRLLVDLLPSDARAGVWLFAAQPHSLVPLGKVDGEWKDRAFKAPKDIHSGGLFTNIEEALKAASKGWEEPDGKVHRSIILLTDGVVDVSKDSEVSKASRMAILERRIPELQRLSARVYTIALSRNADHELLKKLSFDTGGWSRSVQSAGELERAFLTMFRKAVPRDSVPLVSNRFRIDPDIEEFSVLVFRKKGAQPTQLIDPEGGRIAINDQGGEIRWHHEENYDLITIQNPKTGEWRLLADVDPDNHVMVVTDLKLALNDLPNYLSAGETLEISIGFKEKGESLTNPDFLNLIDVRLEQTDELERTRSWMFNADPWRPGRFTQLIAKTLVPGKHRFKIVANARTFQRIAEHRVEVVESPVAVVVSPERGLKADALRVRLIPDAEIIDLPSLQVVARLDRNSGKKERIDINAINGFFDLVVDVPSTGQRTIVNFALSAKTLRGKIVHPVLKPLVIDRNFLDSLNRRADRERSLAEKRSAVQAGAAIEEPDWMKTVIVAGMANLIVLVAGFVLYRFFRNRSARQQAELIDRLTP